MTTRSVKWYHVCSTTKRPQLTPDKSIAVNITVMETGKCVRSKHLPYPLKLVIRPTSGESFLGLRPVKLHLHFK